MYYRNLGRSGLRLSALTLGTAKSFDPRAGGFDRELAGNLMQTAYDHGINSFDSAEGYGAFNGEDGEYGGGVGNAETVMGEVLREVQWPRSTFVLSSKAFPSEGLGPHLPPTSKGLNRKHLFDCCHDSLRRYGVEYLDLFYCHRPDPNCPLEETCQAMHDLVQQGKVMYWGTSCFRAEQLADVYRICDENGLRPPSMEQSCYNIAFTESVESELESFIQSRGLGVLAFSPLQKGVLAGKYFAGAQSRENRYDPDQLGSLPEKLRLRIDQAARWLPLCRELDIPMSALALAGALHNPGISSLVMGASSVSQLTDNIKALDIGMNVISDAVMERMRSL